mmetsp:Transcript_61737/g.127625  ORF Transcript_61737/g.127625 Transcript_61737/m.127625 type:complete len:253 (+) Transcript_61737:3496-4254(+)
MPHTSANRIDVSVRRAIKEQFPNAMHCKDLTGDGNNAKVVNRRKQSLRSAQTSQTKGSGYGQISVSEEACAQAALFTYAVSYMLEQHQTEFAFTSEYAPTEPKSQREARNLPERDEWITAEEVELKTIWDMGTFEVVDTPSHVSLLPSRFTYCIKVNADGTISKFKARLVARGDMQTEDEYSTTFAPTSRFTAIRTIISLACQENMTLKQFDISGAFMTADIDTDIFLEMPPGYQLPDGKCIKLKKSLYGLR